MNLSMKQNMALGSVAVLGLALGQAQDSGPTGEVDIPATNL